MSIPKSSSNSNTSGKLLEFDLPGICEFRGLATDILNEGLVEHSADSLALMRSAYGTDDSEGQVEVDFIERNLSRCGPNRPRLHAEILSSVLAVIKMSGADSLLDIGCGEGLLLRATAREPYMKEVTGIEAEGRPLRAAHALIDVDVNPSSVHLLQQDITTGNLSKFINIGVITLVEVVEHIPDKAWISNALRLNPGILIATTPNREFNALYPKAQLQANGLRHPDHKFEFSRQEFSDWACQAGEEYGYSVSLLSIGPSDLLHGSSGQMVVFQKSI